MMGQLPQLKCLLNQAGFGPDIFDDVQGQLGEFSTGRCLYPPKPGAFPIINIDTVQEQHMEMDIQIQRRSKPLNQRDRASMGHLVGLPSLFDQVCCDNPVDNTEHPTHDLRMGVLTQ